MTEHNQDDRCEEIIKKGRQVFSLYWDTGSPGGGAETDFIYEYEGAYYFICVYDDLQGPYTALAEAIETNELSMINSSSKRIDTVLSLDELLPLLYIKLDPADLPYPFLINGEPWQVNQDEAIVRRKE